MKPNEYIFKCSFHTELFIAVWVRPLSSIENLNSTAGDDINILMPVPRALRLSQFIAEGLDQHPRIPDFVDL